MTEKNRYRTCVHCDKLAIVEYKPFCSSRCANLDLGRWLNESYTIPAVEPPDDWNDD